ncbi:toxin glutamine deamidase domain-containing protein [Nonomuraea sp. NPDC049684]|uniref:toxin glutamine deamidase domain-containing protein n=1 Tax=Nonomuraea sp. NPDC049684 TaxID=3364356 RepID=UPI00379AD10D
MMAGKGDVTTATDEARKPAGGTGAFDGGIATKDVEPVWQTEALPGWVVHHLIPLLTAGQSWPEGSESKLWELRVEYVKLMNLLISTLDPTAATVQTLNGSLQSPAKPAIFKRLAKLYDDKAGVVAKAQESFSYAKMVDNFARETQYTKLSINVAFWIAVIAAFIALIAAGFFPLASLMLRSVGAAGGTRIAMIMQRLALAASRAGVVAKSGQVSKLAGAGAGSFFNKALAYELFEEISEELLIDLTTQYQQIKMGTRDTWDWKKVKAAAIGAGVGAVAGTKLGDPMSRFANDLPGISRLNRIAGDNRGVGNAFLRFPGRALNTGLNNMVASPAGSIVANYAVYDQFALPGAEGFYGGFLGGAGRTNTLSPTNLEVWHAAATPVTSLSNAVAEAMAAQQNGTATPAGPLPVDFSTTGGPQTGPSDSGSSPMVPQSQGTRGGRGTQTPDILTPDTPRPQPAHNTKAQQNPLSSQPQPQPQDQSQEQPQPQPQDEPQAQPQPQDQPQPQPQDQSQERSQGEEQGQAQDQRSAVQDPASNQPSAAVQDTSAAEKTDTQPTTPDPAGAPDSQPTTSDPTSASVESDATAQAPTAAAPDHTAAPQNPDTATTPDTANTAETFTAPDTANTAETFTAPETVNAVGSPAAPEAGRTSETVVTGMASQPAGSPVTGQQGPAAQQAAPVPVVRQTPPGEHAVTGERARTLVSRLIGATRRARSTHAVVGGRPLGRFVADGRMSGVPPLTVEEAQAAFQAEVRASDIGENVTALRWTGPGTLVVEFSDRPAQTFVFTVGRVRRGRLGRTVAYEGNVNRGRLAPGVAPDQVARLVLHEVVDTLHARAHPRQNLLRRMVAQPDGRDECVAARVREEVFLTRRIGEVSGAQRDALVAERAVVRDFLRARGMWPPSTPALEAAPASAPPSIAGLVARMNEQGRAIEYAVLDLDLAVTAQIDRLLRIEADLRLQMMATADTRPNPLLTAVSEARAAYESAQALLHLAAGSRTRVTEFGAALQRARLLQREFEAKADSLVLVPALPRDAGPSLGDVLGGHISALRTAADELTAAARRSPATAADRTAAADSALRAAESYELLLNRINQDRPFLGPPSELVSQLLRLASGYEQHYRQLATPEQAESARASRDIDALHAALRRDVAERQATVAALRSAADEALEAAGEAVKAQRDVVRAYEEATSRAYEQAANALAGKNVEAARAWRAEAAELSALGARHERAESLAIEAREAQRAFRVLLDEAINGNPVDPALLTARMEAAAEALETYREALAELRAQAPPPSFLTPPAADGPRDTEVRRLWKHVQNRARDIEAAGEHAATLAAQHRRAAQAAEQQARTARQQATDPRGGRRRVAEDDGAARRRWKAAREADAAAATADFHALVAHRYEAAAEAAAYALEAVGLALTALTETSRTEPPANGEVDAALAELESRWAAYEAAREANLPSPLALLGVFRAGPVAEVAALTELVNDLLARKGVAARLTEDELESQVRQAFRAAVSQDGMILRLNAAGATVRIRLKLSDLEEVAGPPGRSSETILGRMRQGGGPSSRTDRRSKGFDFNKDLVTPFRWLMKRVPWVPHEELQKLALYLVVNAHFGWGNAQSVSTSSQENWQGGNVEDYRGKSSRFAAKASWEVEVSTPSGAPVAGTRPAGDATQRQGLWVPHSYLLDPPANPLHLPENERQHTPFPEHVVTAMTGLGRLAERVARRIDSLDLSPVALQQILTTITEDLPSYLGQAVNDPSGLRRTITVDGVARAVVTVRTTVLPGALPVGGTSAEHPQEALRNASSHAGRQRSANENHGGGGGVGVNLNPQDPDPTHPIGIDQDREFTPQLVPYSDWGRASSTSVGASAVSMRAGVHKSVGHTAGFMLGLMHTVTIQVDGHPPIRLAGGGNGLFRIAESAAYRYGLPVDPAAEVGRDANGDAVLRDDPVKANPPGRVGRLPSWLGNPPDHVRGAGPALVQQVTGMNEVRAQVEEYLRGQGVLPELVEDVPVYSRIPWVRASQMANEQLVAEQFSAERLETGYDQAAQEGLFINLVHYRELLAAEHYTLRIRLTQHFGAAGYEGVTDAVRMTNLDIGSDTHTLTRTGNSSWKWGAKLDAGFKDDPGVDVGHAGGSFGRGRGTTDESGTARTVNQVTLLEGDGPSAVFRVPHTIQVDRLIGPNISRTVVEGQAGEARIVLPADLLPFAPADDGHPRPRGPRFRTEPAVLRRATIVHLDVGDVASAAARELDTRLRAGLDRDSPAFQHLAAFFNVRGLISHREVFSTGHRTGVDTRAGHQQVGLRLDLGESRFLSVADMVVGDINLTLAAHNDVQRSSRPREVAGGLDVPLSVPVEPGSEGAGASWGHTTSEEHKTITGPERLGIDTGKQYVFAMGVTPQLTVDGQEGRLRDGTVVYMLSERDALELYADEKVRLPLHQVADAAERLMNGDLKLGRRVAITFMDRYLTELEKARDNHPSGVPGLSTLPGIPLTSGHTVERALAALLALFDADRLAAFMPPGVPEGRPDELPGDTIDRMLSRPELHPQIRDALLAAAARLANGEVPAQLAPAYQHALGMSTVKGVSLHPAGAPGTEVELLDAIMDAVRQVAPDAFADDVLLERALTADFSGDTWLGKIDDMLDPDHPGGEYILHVDGDAEPLQIVVRAELGDDVQYRGEVFDYGQILQRYTMSEENVAESSSLTASPHAKGATGGTSLTGATDWGRSGTGSSNVQQTQLRRASSFTGARAEVRQGITLTIEVRRSPSRNARPVRTTLSGTIDRLVPPGMTAAVGEVSAPVAVPDPRPLPVPESFTTESTRADGLARAVERQLEAEHGVKLSPEDSRKLAWLLSGNSRNGIFPFMLARDGHMVLKVPGRRGREVKIYVGAILSEATTTAGGLSDLEIGQADRRQWTTRADASDTRLRPLSLTGSSPEDDESFLSDLLSRLTRSLADKVGVTAGVRDQSGDGSSVSGGNRDETSVFEQAGTSSSVRFRVDYTVRFEVTRGSVSEKRGETRRVATGEADVLVADHVLAAIMREAEDPPPLPAEQEPPGVPGPTQSLAALRQGGLDVRQLAGALEQGGLDVRQLAGALAALPDPVVHLDADLPLPPYGQLRQAQLAARALGGDLWVTVRLPDGSPLTYLATPDGRLWARGQNGDFGRRFSGVPTALVALAEQHGIDLHALDAATRADTPLAESLRNELRRRAVPPSAAPAPGWTVSGKPDDAEDGTAGDGHTHASPMDDSLFVADGRPADEDDLTVDEAREAFKDVLVEDFGGVAGTWRVLWEDGDTLTLESDLLGRLHFRFEVGPVEGGYLGQTTVLNKGSESDPHVVTLTPRVAEDQVARLVLHEISDVLQYRMERAHGHTHAHTTGDATRDECVTARRNELLYLERKQREALAAGDTDAADRLGREIVAVKADLDRRTGPPHSIDALINWTESNEPQPEATNPEGDSELAALEVRGAPEHVAANVSKVTMADGSSALLVEELTPQGRNLTLLMTELAHRLGLVGHPRAAGDRHILIDWTPTSSATSSSDFLGTREAVLAGYLVALADITPLVTSPALHVLASRRPLLDLFLRKDASGRLEWASNPLSPSDLVALETMLVAAREDFARSGLQTQFDQIMERHRSLAGGPLVGNAAGRESVLAAAPGQYLRLGMVEQLSATADQGSPSTRTGTKPAAGSRTIDPVLRLRDNLRQGVVSKRPSASLGDVVTFADGSQGLEVPAHLTAQVLVQALVRRVLGIAGPAVHVDGDGVVWRTFGNDRLRVSLTTGIVRSVEAPGPYGRTTEVTFGDGRRALRHEFPTRELADEFEATLEELIEARDGVPGSHRANRSVVYEEITTESPAEAERRLATRALYALLRHGRSPEQATLRRLLDANPLLARFGTTVDGRFQAGAPVLSARVVADLTAKLEELRALFAVLDLDSRHEWLLNTLNSLTGSDEAGLIPLAFSEDLTTPEYRVPAWQPPPGSDSLLAELLRNDHLAQAYERGLFDLIAQAEAELAGRPTAAGCVFAWVPGKLIPSNAAPGDGFFMRRFIDGVDDGGDIDLLAEHPTGVRVTVLSTGYVPVGDLSGKPHHATLRTDAPFVVTAVLRTPDGTPHYFLTQTSARPRSDTMVTPAIRLSSELARDLAALFQDTVDRTPAGVRVRSGRAHDAAPSTTPATQGVFVVEGRYVEQGMMVGGRRLRAEAVAAMLLIFADLPPGATILLAGPHDGTTDFAQELARFTDRVVLAADGPAESATEDGPSSPDALRSLARLKIFLPADTSGLVAAQLRAWLRSEIPQMDEPLTLSTPGGWAGPERLPLAEIRPRNTGRLYLPEPLTETEEARMRGAYLIIRRILEQAGGRALRASEIERLLPHINPLRGTINCAEVALAVDDILSGRPAVAGLRGEHAGTQYGIYIGRALRLPLHMTSSLEEAENLVRQNPGSRGILVGHRASGAGHAWNLANTDDGLFYIDGQPAWMSAVNRNDRGFVSYRFYPTA